MLILLLVTFRTVVSATVPLILGAAAVVTATALIYLIGSQTDTSIFALNVASMIGLGLGDRLLADRRQPLPRGAREEWRPPGGFGDHDGDRRPLDRLLRRSP